MKSLITLGDEFACVHPVSRFSQHVGDIDILRPPQRLLNLGFTSVQIGRSVRKHLSHVFVHHVRKKKKNLNDRGKGAVKMNPCFTKQKLFLGGDCYSHTHTHRDTSNQTKKLIKPSRVAPAFQSLLYTLGLTTATEGWN